MTPYSLDAKADKCMMIKPVLVGRRNPKTPNSGMNPRIPVAAILGNPVAVFLTTVYWEHVLKLPADPRLAYAVFGVGLMPTLYLLVGTFLSKGGKEEIKGEIQTMGNTLLRIKFLLGGSPVRDHPGGPPPDLRR